MNNCLAWATCFLLLMSRERLYLNLVSLSLIFRANNRRFLFSVLDLDLGYNWQAMAPNTHHSLFSISNLIVRTYKLNLKLQLIYGRSVYRTTVLLSKTFFVWFRREIRLENYRPRHASVILMTQHCVCVYTVLQTRTYIAICCTTTMIKNLTYLMTAYYTPSDGLLPMMYRFIRAKLGSHTTRCRVFFN